MCLYLLGLIQDKKKTKYKQIVWGIGEGFIQFAYSESTRKALLMKVSKLKLNNVVLLVEEEMVKKHSRSMYGTRFKNIHLVTQSF